MHHVEVQQVIEAPLTAVFDRYTDHLSWGEWAGLGTVTLARRGSPSPNGVGAVRVFANMGIKTFEEVISYERPRRMTYRLVKGPIPIKDHLGEVLFTSHPGGTLVTWRCQFTSTIPGLGGIMQRFITKLFRNALTSLARTSR